MNFLHFYFNPKGVLATKQFAWGCAGLIVLCFLLSMLWYVMITGPDRVQNNRVISSIFYLRLALAYPFFCILTKRFHSSGKGWAWSVMLIVAFLLLSFILQMTISMYFMSGEEYWSQVRQIPFNEENIETHRVLRREMLQKTYLPVIGVYLLLLNIFSFAVGWLKPKIENNKYAPDYEGTFS